VKQTDGHWYTIIHPGRIKIEQQKQEFPMVAMFVKGSRRTELLELMILWSVYFMVKFRIFIPELWDFIHQIVGDFSYVTL
jgi:hypothetical protein